MSAELDGKVRSDKPLMVVSDLQELILQVQGDASCKRPNCHGRGYIGINRREDGTASVLLCTCGSFGKTPYVKMARAFEGAWKQSEQSFVDQFKLLTDVVTSVAIAQGKRIEELGEGVTAHIGELKNVISGDLNIIKAKCELLEIQNRNNHTFLTNYVAKLNTEMKNQINKEAFDTRAMISDLQSVLNHHHEEIKKRTFWGGIGWAWSRVFGRKG